MGGRYTSGLSTGWSYWSCWTEDSAVRWILDHLSSTGVLSNETYHQKRRRSLCPLAAVVFCVCTCMSRQKSSEVHRYSVDGCYACGTEWGCYATWVSVSTLPVTSCVIWGRSFNYCVPHFSHLYGGGYNTLHLPTSQGFCGDSRGSISVMLSTSGQWCNANLFYSSLCFINVRVWGWRTFRLGQQSLAKGCARETHIKPVRTVSFLFVTLLEELWEELLLYALQNSISFFVWCIGMWLTSPPPPPSSANLPVFINLEKIKLRTTAG